jgi:hypothetical protein
MDQTVRTVIPVNWPKEPYKGFSYYDAEDSLLFTGRDEDVDNCVAYLTEANTRTFLLHGNTGCGKSSFLRAALIPALESRGFGFVFLRRDESARPAIIRCTADPIARIAEQVFWFVKYPWPVETAVGSREVDLSSTRMGRDDIQTFVEACRDPYTVMNVLKEIATKLFHTLVIVIDQGEEAITGDSSPFFAFMKVFNSTSLPVKILISLRTDRFGEFFGYLHFGPSAITDVKHYFLPGLERHAIKKAIELPTFTARIGDCDPPFDVYQFSYENGLVDKIVNDLIAAPPSGGVLPLMQVVCRRLHNEVRSLPVPRTITNDLYQSGGSVSGWVDREITASLQSAIQNAGPNIRDVAQEERRWRAGLYKLVRTQPDGAVATEVKTEKELVQLLTETGATARIPAVLLTLTRPDILILRSFTVVSPVRGSEETCYSLGHDAIALVLHQWMLREEEAKKRRINERRWFRGAMTALGLAMVGFLAVTWWQNEAYTLQRVSVLQSFATTSSSRYPGVAATAAITSWHIANHLWLSTPAPDPRQTLEKIAATLPRWKVDATWAHPNSSGGFFLPVSQRILFWNKDEGIKIASLDGSSQSKIGSDELLKGQTISNTISLANAVEESADLLLLRFKDDDRSFVSVIRNGHVADTFNVDTFKVQHLSSPTEQKSDSSASPIFLVDQKAVYFIEKTLESLSATLFRYPPVDTNYFVAEGGTKYTTEDTGTEIKNYSTIPPGIIVLQIDSKTLSSNKRAQSDDNAIGKPSSSFNDKRLKDVIAYDLTQEGKVIWSLDSQTSPAAHSCLDRIEPSGNNFGPHQGQVSRACVFRFQDHQFPGYMAIQVPPEKSRENLVDTPENEQEVSKDSKDKGNLVIVDLQEHKTPLDFDWGKLVEKTKGVIPGGGYIQPLGEDPIVFGGTFDSLVLAVPDALGLVFDVFKIARGDPTFIGTYTGSLIADHLFFSTDTNTMLLISEHTAKIWDISKPTKAMAERFRHMSAKELVQSLCDAGVPTTVDNKKWLTLVGLDIPSVDPCSK